MPWITWGDFNVIINEEEKLDRLNFERAKATDFSFFINFCGLEEFKFSGNQIHLGIKPTLFIIAAEVLSRGLNTLNHDGKYKGFGLAKWIQKINHLAYTDDTIFFTLGDKNSVIKMMKVTMDYGLVLGKKVNKNKSHFYLNDNTPLNVAIWLRRLTNIR